MYQTWVYTQSHSVYYKPSFYSFALLALYNSSQMLCSVQVSLFSNNSLITNIVSLSLTKCHKIVTLFNIYTLFCSIPSHSFLFGLILKWYYDQKITSFFPSDFKRVFVSHLTGKILRFAFYPKAVFLSAILGFQGPPLFMVKTDRLDFSGLDRG